ncbi:MAG TPA: secretin N-terminal domain-containing protein [Anaerohalosphaeraceae bacterium]|nr:secretin N-terminal domain-containing protein [Anaerohalosphaeraceae bacterium]
MHLNRCGRLASQSNWRLVIGLLAIWFISYEQICPAGEPSRTGVERSRLYRTNHRTAEEIKSTLLQLGIGRRVDALSDKILIVTSDQPDDLIRASSLLQMLDHASVRILKQWQPSPVGLPNPEYLFEQMKLSELQVGTLLDPPASNASDPLLLDEYKGGLLAVGSEAMIGQLEQIINQWIAKHQPKPTAAPAPSAETTPAPASTPQAAPTAPAVQEPNQPQAEPAAVPSEPSAETPAQPTAPAAAAEPNQSAAPQDEDFFSQELMKALTAAQEKAEEIQKEIEAEKQTAQDQGEEEQALLDVIEALRRRAETEETAAKEPNRPETAAEKTPAAEPQPQNVPVSLLARLEEQLARQEQQITELKALLAERSKEQEKKVQPAPSLPEPVIPEGEKELELTITLPEKVEITQLIELVGKQLGLNYMYDPTQVRGDVQLKIHDGKIKVKDTYALLESVMRFKGFVMTRRGNLVTIVPASQIKQADPVIVSPDEPIVPGDVIVSSVFQLKHISPAAAQKMLTDLQLGTSFVPVNETNTLIVTDYSYRMDRINQVIALVDVAGEPKRFAYRQLQYTSAADILNKLKTLTAQMSGISVASAPSSEEGAAARSAAPIVQRDAQGRVIATRPQPTPQPPAAAPTTPTQETVFLDTDERTNRILIIGYAAQIQTIQELIDTLDVPKYYLRYVREYFIQHVEAAEVVTALNELGLANVNIGSQSASRQTTTARPTLARTTQPGQPVQAVQPTAAPAAATGGEDQPYISIRPNTNSLLVNATKDQHEAIEMVISHVDVKQKDQRTIQEYEIQNVDALSVVKTLEDLGIIAPGKSEESRSQTRSTAAGTRQTAGQMMQPAQPEMPTALALPTIEGETVTELAASQPQIAILESTNSLLVHATPRQHEAISLVIAHVDRTLERVSTPYVVYPLENQDPEELAEVLNELIQETMQQQTQKSSPDAKIQTAPTPTTTPLPTKEEERIRIIPDPKTYSLIVYANKKNQQWVGDLIRELDQYRPQVLLDCTLVEITKNEKFEYDLDIISKTYSETDLRSGTGSGALIGQLDSFTSDRYADARVTTSAEKDVFKAFYNSAHVQGLLTAIQTKGYGRIMARPKILVNDNQEGEIKTENQTSIAQQKSIVQPATGTSPSYTTTDVSFADYSSGITLKIKPHISKGDMLRLEISLNRKDFDFSRGKDVTVAGETYPRPPDLLSTDVNTVATVPDGTTIILGGLETIKQSKGTSKMPLIGDLPIVGGLFRGVDDSGQQGKLYVFVKANIIRPGDRGGMDDMRRVSGRNRRAFEEEERQFQRAQDWPGIEPKPMEPERVLEEDEVQTSEEEQLY